MQKKWVFAENSPDSQVKDFAEELQVPEVIAQILCNRGITTRDEAVKFFKPRMDRLYDPLIMRDMSKAVDRIQEALTNQEGILIYGDYDVDGITSCSLLFLYIRKLTQKVYYFIPDRIKDGYGFSSRGVQEAKRVGATLIITVDCGITAVEEIGLANEQGIDVIVTDHHQMGKELPPAYAILNPMVPECEYPFKGLSGVGVAFKLVHALNNSIGWDNSQLLPYTDLVAIGSAADIVPLVDENRILVKEGIERINGRHNIGLNALLDVASLNNCFIGTGQILFGIAPRINAVGRLGSAERAVKLFITSKMEEAVKIAAVLESENQQRKNIEEIAFNEAVEKAKEEFNWNTPEPLVLFAEGWHPGVIGIVASKIVDQFYRPAVMIAIEDGIGKGSIRSIPDFDVFEALQKCGNYLEEYGGHKYAAGLTIKESNIPVFKEAFKNAVTESLTSLDLVPRLNIDSRIELDIIDDRFFNILKHFAPFGPQNSRPVFVAEGIEVTGRPTIVGKNHLKFSIRQNGAVLPVIGFNLGHLIDTIYEERDSLDMAFVIEENTWQGNTYLQLQLKDIKSKIKS
ncbi:MAG: single-stranded-DNA-specific exonuclease RecJ [bacterium]|nr:single-stranded-DNA-specific exonuclease RecJ [bacterium]